MGTGQQVGAGRARQATEDVEGSVETCLESGFLDPFREPAPPGEIGIRPGQPVDAAIREPADGRQGPQVLEQTLRIDVAHSQAAAGSKGWQCWKRPKSGLPTTSPSW